MVPATTPLLPQPVPMLPTASALSAQLTLPWASAPAMGPQTVAAPAQSLVGPPLPHHLAAPAQLP
eukprot:11066345-Alexandrium_andersonii.AAC.1